MIPKVANDRKNTGTIRVEVLLELGGKCFHLLFKDVPELVNLLQDGALFRYCRKGGLVFHASVNCLNQEQESMLGRDAEHNGCG